MTTAPRYAITDLPGGAVKVRVYWEARLFEAARIFDTGAKRWRWATLGRDPYTHEAVTTWLPPRGQRWAAEPDWWQPIDLETWIWPGGRVPAPLYDSIMRQMVSVSGSRRWDSMADQAAKSAATQAEIAAELGPDADAGAAIPMRVGTRWWRDSTRVTYASAIQPVPLLEAEGRLCRAILTDGLRPGQRPLAWLGVSSGLAELMHDHMTATDADLVQRWEPLKADLDDYERGHPMRWLAALDPPEMRHRQAEAWRLNGAQTAIVLHAMGHGWREAGRRSGQSGRACETAYMAAIEAVWRVANGRPAYKHRKMVDQVSALQARNRAHARREREREGV